MWRSSIAEDEYGQRLVPMARAAGCEVVEFGLNRGDFRAAEVQLGANGTRFQMVTPTGSVDLQTHLPGPVNVLNLLAASAAAMARGLTHEEIARGVEAIAYVPGRFQTVDCGQPFTVAVDYAHTDDALRNVTRLARQLAASTAWASDHRIWMWRRPRPYASVLAWAWRLERAAILLSPPATILAQKIPARSCRKFFRV